MPRTEPRQQKDSRYEGLARAPAAGFASDLLDFLRNSKRWWLTPIVVVFVVFGLLLALSAAGGAPFIYTLF